MNLYQLLILQFIAHLISDFILQSQKGAEEKDKLGFKSKFLRWHVLITFGIAWLFSFQVDFIYGAFAIAALHWLEDGVKKYMNDNSKTKRYVFFIDQTIHLVIIISVVLTFNSYFLLTPVFEIPIRIKTLLIVTGFIICTKPANVFIKEVFIAFDIQVIDANIKELPNAGKLIGIVERFLVLIFIIIHQFEAVGFLIAAKSILRFKNDYTIKIEYVLIGTLLSFGIAIALGVAVNFC